MTDEEFGQYRVLFRRWEDAQRRLEAAYSDFNYRAEADAWDELIDYVEAENLNGTVLDPR